MILRTLKGAAGLALFCVALALISACSDEAASTEAFVQKSGVIKATVSEAAMQTTLPETTEKIATAEPIASKQRFNDDLLSEIGMSYTQVVEKYGEPTNSGGYDNVKCFENSYGGRYFWDDGSVYNDGIENAGGLIGIDGVKPEKLFVGLTVPVSFEELEHDYGFEFDVISEEIGMSDDYWSSFSIGDIDVVVYSNEPRVINEKTGLMVRQKSE